MDLLSKPSPDRPNFDKPRNGFDKGLDSEVDGGSLEFGTVLGTEVHLARVPAKSQQALSLDWLVWQLADSAFPAGGFAHSNGLEAAWQQGEVRSSEELAEFVQEHLAQTGSATIPFVNEAFHERRPFIELDRLCDVFLSNHVANRGSRAQGQAFLLAAANAVSLPLLLSLRATALDEKLPSHFAPIFGAVLRSLGISHAQCLRLFLFMSLRGLLGSAVRLGIIGPMAAQSLQVRLAPVAEQIGLHRATTLVDQAAQSSPLLEILHGAHNRLYSRLFQT